METLGPYELNRIYTGDARELSESIPDNSIDLIFTDPPYPKEYLYLYEWLAKEGARILKPGGTVMALCGHAYLPYILEAMGRYLTYHWINCQYQPTATNTAAFWPRMVYIRWKPIVWFVKGRYTNRFFIQDGISPMMQDKRFHQWGQPVDSATYWLYQITAKNEDSIVFDPFTGGGTVPAVSKMLGRNYLAFEIDEATADKARERVLMTQPPLFVPEPVQLELG